MFQAFIGPSISTSRLCGDGTIKSQKTCSRYQTRRICTRSNDIVGTKTTNEPSKGNVTRKTKKESPSRHVADQWRTTRPQSIPLPMPTPLRSAGQKRWQLVQPSRSEADWRSGMSLATYFAFLFSSPLLLTFSSWERHTDMWLERGKREREGRSWYGCM